MARRLPSSLSNCLRACQLYRNGQTCYDCPNRGLSTCPLPDMEDLFRAKPAPSIRRSRIVHEEHELSSTPDLCIENITKTPEMSGSHLRATLQLQSCAALNDACVVASIPKNEQSYCPLPAETWSFGKRGLYGLLSMPSRRSMGVSPSFAKSGSFASFSTSAASATADRPAASQLSLRDIPGLQKLIVTTSMGAAHSQSQATGKLVPLSSDEGKLLFTEALASGGLENYFTLSEQYLTQADPSISAVSSLAMVLNALNHDPKRTWKGPWRWNTEEVVQCTGACGHSLDALKKNGISFAELVAMARCQGVRAQPVSAAMSTEADLLVQFRNDVKSICGDSASQAQIIVNFSRASLDQHGGDGHFSPLGGYNAESDMVLILDVDRYNSPPFWVPLTRLWSAMTSVDMKSGRTRGYVILSTWHSSPTPAVTKEDALCPLMIRSWSEHKRGGNCCRRGRHHAHHRRTHPRRAPAAHAALEGSGQGVGRAASVQQQKGAVGGGSLLSSEGKLDAVMARSRLMHTARVHAF